MASSFERTIDLARADLGSPAFERWHAQVARETLAQVLAERGDNPDVLRIVDGVKERLEDDVKLHGVIRYEFIRDRAVVPEVLRWLIAEARKVSPKYADFFFVGVFAEEKSVVRGKRVTRNKAEGRPIPAAQFGTMHLPPNASFVVGNTRPFNRKVDVQLIGGDKLHFTIEDQIYERCALALRSKFKEYRFRRVYTLLFTGQYKLETGPRKGTKVQSPGLIIERV